MLTKHWITYIINYYIEIILQNKLNMFVVSILTLFGNYNIVDKLQDINDKSIPAMCNICVNSRLLQEIMISIAAYFWALSITLLNFYSGASISIFEH